MAKRFLSPLFLVIWLTACGGGGGGGDGETFFGGVYRGLVAITENPCGVPVSTVGDVEWTVNQDASRIVLQAASGATYEGGPTGGSSFAVSRVTPSGANCPITSDIAMTDVDSDSSRASLSVRASCLPQCTVRGTGSLSRAITRSSDAPKDGPRVDLLEAIAGGLKALAGSSDR
jgi:hypothetical protein